MEWQNWHSWSHEEKLKGRLWIALNQHDRETQALLRAICKQDPIFFIEAFCWTFDPGKTPARMPFILYPFQVDFIKWLEEKLKNKESGLVEKSRQMGISWLTLTWLLYHWIFDEEFVGLIGSRTEVLVDKRDKADTLFQKLDFNLRYLPKWILPYKFSPSKDRRHLILVNPRSNNTLQGESSNKNFGRGSTISVAVMDEFAAWETAYDSYMSIGEATKVRIVVSTPKSHTYFKTLRFSKKIDVKTLHWRLHPERDQAWYENQLETKSAEVIAQEVDISYDVSGQGKVYEESELVPVGNYPYNSKWPLYTATDYGVKDSTAIIWLQQDPETKKVYVIDSYQNDDKLIDFYIPFYKGEIPKDKERLYNKIEKEQIRKHFQWKKARHFGDPAGKQRSQVTNTSVIRELARAGIFVFTNEKAKAFPPRREATKMLLRVLHVNKGNEYFLDCIKQARYPERRETSQSTKAVDRPVHDFSSHFRTALEYFAVNVSLIQAKPRRLNYLKNFQKDEDGNISEEIRKKQKKRRIIRWGRS